MLWAVPVASAIHLAATGHGEFITLVPGKWRSLLMTGNNHEVYDKKRQYYAEDNVNIWQSYHRLCNVLFFMDHSV